MGVGRTHKIDEKSIQNTQFSLSLIWFIPLYVPTVSRLTPLVYLNERSATCCGCVSRKT